MSFGDKDKIKQVIRFDFEDRVAGTIKGTDGAGNVVKTAILETGGGGKRWQSEHRVSGKKGFAYSFGGKEEKRYLSFKHPLESDDFTVAFWVKPDNI